jgi:putative ABC transport system permease protein
VLTVALSCTLYFSTTTIEHAITQQRHAALTGQLAITDAGPGLPPAALRDARLVPGVRSAVALTATSLGPSLGDSGDTLPVQILAGGQGGGLDAGVTAGSLGALHGDTIALGRHRADAAHARIGERVRIMLGDGTPAHATVVAIYSDDLAFGDALLSPDLVVGHQTTPMLGTILIRANHPAAVAPRLQALATRYPGLRVSGRASLASVTDGDREMNRWFGPQFVAEIFAFTSIAVITTLLMIALRRRRELALMRLVGATRRQVRSMARWEAALIITIGLGVGLAIAAAALLPLSQALNGGLPYIPTKPFVAIVGVTALLAFLALALPTRHVLRTRPVEAIGTRE